jgi:FkbM family methyltransferase
MLGEYFLSGLGARLGAHPRIASAVLAALRRVPGRRLRGVVYIHVSRPLVRRMTGRIVVRVEGGARMSVDLSDVVGRMLATSGIWEPHVTAAFGRLLAPGDVFVDVGAHVGYYTLLASNLVGPEGHVYALEPAPRAYRELRANLSLNGVSNVSALPIAAGAGEGEARLFEGPPWRSGSSAIRANGGEAKGAVQPAPVHVRPLSAVIKPSHLARLRLVKIDVEGYEVEVLRGFAPIFARGGRPALLVELHGGRAHEGARLLAELSGDYGLRSYELVEPGACERFRPLSPREVSSPLEPASVFSGRGCNLLLTP